MTSLDSSPNPPAHLPGAAGTPAPEASEDGLRQLTQRFSSGYRSVGVMVYDILREAIVSGMLAPGQKLRQEVLAEQIGVSRVPIRQALIQLESDGLVDLRDRRSAVVTTLTPAQVREVYNIRIVLETHALRLSMQTMTPERVDRIKKLAHVADAEREGATFLDARSEFYAELYDAPRQPMLWELIEQLRLKVGRYVLGWRLISAGGHSHEALLDAVAAGDADAALNGLRHHLQMVRDAVVARVEAAGQ